MTQTFYESLPNFITTPTTPGRYLYSLWISVLSIIQVGIKRDNK